MQTRKHVHEETFAADPETVFNLLVTPSAIRKWWGATHAVVDKKEGGIWVGVWGDEDAPDFITFNRMRVYDPPKRVMFADFEYYARTGGLPFAHQLTAEFTVIPEGPNNTKLRVVQDGFPCAKAADDFYAACEVGWRDTYAGIRRYLSSNKSGQ
jgi:uncharacterized protein YndB with AHSA1/START domain